MSKTQRVQRLNPRTLTLGSVVAVLFGVASVIVGGPALTTAGVLAVIVGAVALLLAVGTYLEP